MDGADRSFRVLTAWAALRGMGQKTKLFSLFSALLVLVIVVFLEG